MVSIKLCVLTDHDFTVSPNNDVLPVSGRVKLLYLLSNILSNNLVLASYERDWLFVRIRIVVDVGKYIVMTKINIKKTCKRRTGGSAASLLHFIVTSTCVPGF